MTDLNERWHRVGEAIHSRMLDLGMLQADLARASKLSRERLRALIAGEPGNYRPATRAKVCTALGWTTDSIDRILEGHGPTLTGPAGGDAARGLVRSAWRHPSSRDLEPGDIGPLLTDLWEAMSPPSGPTLLSMRLRRIEEAIAAIDDRLAGLEEVAGMPPRPPRDPRDRIGGIIADLDKIDEAFDHELSRREAGGRARI